MRGASIPATSASARSTTISVSGRGTSARASVRSVSRAEPPLAEHVGERLAPAAPLDEHPRRRALVLGQRPVVPGVELEPRKPERLGEQQSASSARRVDALALEELRGRAERLAERHAAALECPALLVGGERLGERVELAPSTSGRGGGRDAHAVVGNPVLRKVVGADLLGARARADLRVPRRRLLGLLPLALRLVEPRAQHAHRLVAVLELRALVLHRHGDARRQVCDADGRVGGVDRLSTGAG